MSSVRNCYFFSRAHIFILTMRNGAKEKRRDLRSNIVTWKTGTWIDWRSNPGTLSAVLHNLTRVLSLLGDTRCDWRQGDMVTIVIYTHLHSYSCSHFFCFHGKCPSLTVSVLNIDINTVIRVVKKLEFWTFVKIVARIEAFAKPRCSVENNVLTSVDFNSKELFKQHWAEFQQEICPSWAQVTDMSITLP